MIKIRQETVTNFRRRVMEGASIVLNDGFRMPMFGFGTFQLRGENCMESVRTALVHGYRLIDTATIYKNEVEVGKGIKQSGVPRESIFLTTKISPKQTGYENALNAIHESLQKLETDYVDLCLMHWPGASGMKLDDSRQLERRIESWRALETAKSQGLVRSIGVSNFTPRHIDHLCNSPLVTVVPAVNQVELHPHYPQLDLVNVCREKGIAIQAYSSLAQGELLDNDVIKHIASESKCNPAQLCLKWALEHGYGVIPRSSNVERIIDNYKAACADHGNIDIEITNMLILDNMYITSHKKYCWDPETVI